MKNEAKAEYMAQMEVDKTCQNDASQGAQYPKSIQHKRSTQACMQSYLLENAHSDWREPISLRLYEKALDNSHGRERLAQHYSERFMLFSRYAYSLPSNAQFPGLPFFSKNKWMSIALNIGAKIIAMPLTQVISRFHHKAYSSVLGDALFTETIKYIRTAGDMPLENANKQASVKNQQAITTIFRKIDPAAPARSRQQLRFIGISAYIEFWRRYVNASDSSHDIHSMYIEVLTSLFPKSWQLHLNYLAPQHSDIHVLSSSFLTELINSTLGTTISLENTSANEKNEIESK